MGSVRMREVGLQPAIHELFVVEVDPSAGEDVDVDAALSNEGNFLGASAIIIDGVADPEIAKAAACREGLALSSDLACRKVTLASDCQRYQKIERSGNRCLRPSH
jgi:hypothetical protein